jgi:hypothetical protein
MRRKHVHSAAIATLMAMLGLAACTQQPRVAPRPTEFDNRGQPPPPPAAAQTTLRGYVSDSAGRALDGATVEILDGPQAGHSALTDATGWFTLVGTFEDSTRLRASKDGHYPTTGTVAFQRGDGPAGYVTFILAVPAAPVDLTGDYELTFIADDTCQAVPAELRTRTYPVSVAADPSPRNPPGTFLWANIIGVPYFANQYRIPLLVAGDAVTFWLSEHGYGAAFVEQVGPNAYLEFQGGTTVSVGTSPVSTISTTFSGWVDYCVLRSPMPGQYFDCDAARAITNVSCEANNHRLILKRR